VSAGEPPEASFDDFPRPDGLGARAIQRERRCMSYGPGAIDIHPAKKQAGATALACWPLVVGHEAVGALYVYRCDSRRFSDTELLILDNFVQFAAIAIHDGRKTGGLSRALGRKVRQLETLNRASNLISSRTNLEETLQEILFIGLDLTAAQYGSFETFDRRRNLLVTRALAGSKEPPGSEPPLPVDELSVVGWAALHRQSVRIDDIRRPPWRNIYHRLPVERDMRSELVVPIFGTGGALEGILNIESPQPNAFSERDRQLLESLGVHAGHAIQEIRLLDALQDIAEHLLNTDGDALLKLIVDRACDLINVSDGSIWLVSAPDTLVLRQSTDPTRHGETLSLQNSFTGQAVRLRRPIAIDDVRLNPNFMRPELAQERGWVSAIVVPLLASKDDALPVGSFALYAPELRDFSDWDKKLLTVLANHAAVAIRDAEQLRLLQQARERQATAETIAAVGDVAANLLHQLNNKFGAISVRVQGIEAKCPEALEAWPYLQKSLGQISASVRQAQSIVHDSMAPLQPLKPQPVQVADCLRNALNRANLPETVVAEQRGLVDLPPVRAAGKQLEMVFYNLIDNAQQAMGGTGTLTISGVVDGDCVAVSVADTGVGIPPERQAAIFELASAATNRRTGRLSFGLWWVKTFVDRFGGRIEVDSKPGQGSTFTVWLPIERNA
ncbi:MAG: GAF domain-containing protein, partial [Chloroflexi bacterium]